MFFLHLWFLFTFMSQGSVETHLRCGGIRNNHVIANCLQTMSVKNFENRSLICEDMDKSEVPRFYGPRCILIARIRYLCITTGERLQPKHLGTNCN